MASGQDGTHTDVEPLATLLRRWRLTAGLSQEALAEHSGLSVNGIAQIETGKRTAPRASTLRMLADALDLDAERRRTLALAARRGPDTGGIPRNMTPLPAAPPELPVPPTPLVGREAEIAALVRLLREDDLPMVTLTGPGGVGKTRLALAVAYAWVASEGSAVIWVELAAIADQDQVAGEIARMARVPESPARPVIESLAEAFRARSQVLVLDNCEHLAPAVARVASRLLERCPALRIVATSRSPLHIQGERLYPVPTLALPNPDCLPGPAELAVVDAVALFMQRARAARPGFVLTERNAATIAEICRRLDGLPLALVLAASRTRVLSPEALLGLLGERLRLLVGGPVDEHARLQTLRAAVSWSHDLLTPAQQQLFRQIGVFAGGCTLDAASSVAATDDHIGVLDGVEALVDQSLLVRIEQPDGGLRFGMLETFRAYALEQLDAHGETHDARSRHAAWCLALAESLGDEVDGPRHVEAMRRLETEHANLLHALTWLDGQGDAEQMQRLAASLTPWWHAAGTLSEAVEWLERSLARSDLPVSDAARAAALVAAGQVVLLAGDFDRARAYLGDGILMARTHGPRDAEVAGLYWLGCLEMFTGTFEEARAHSATCLALARASGASARASAALWSLGFIAMAQGDITLARRRLDESLALARQAGSPTLGAHVLCELANLEYRQGRFARAQERAAEALALGRETGHRVTTGQALGLMTEVARARGEWDDALRLAEEHVASLRPGGVGVQLAWGIRNLGFAAMETGAPERAAALFAESLTMFREQGVTLGIASNVAGVATLAARHGQLDRANRLLGAMTILLDDAGLTLAPADAIAFDRAAPAGARPRDHARRAPTATTDDVVTEALGICASMEVWAQRARAG